MSEGSTLADALKETTSKSAGYRTLEKTSAQLGAFIAGEAMEPSLMRDLCTGLRADEAQTSFMMGLTGASGSKATESSTDAIYARLREAREPDTIQPDGPTARKAATFARLHSTVSRQFTKLDGPTKFIAMVIVLPLVAGLVAGGIRWADMMFSPTRTNTIMISAPAPGRYDPGLGNVALVAFPQEGHTDPASTPFTLDDVDDAVIADEDGEAPVLKIEIDPGADLGQDGNEAGIVPILVSYHAPQASPTAIDENPTHPPIQLSADLQVYQRTAADPEQHFYALAADHDAERIWDLPTAKGWWASSEVKNSGSFQPWQYGSMFEVGWTEGDTVAEAGTELGIRTADLPCGVSEMNLEATLRMRNAPQMDSVIRRIGISIEKKCVI